MNRQEELAHADRELRAAYRQAREVDAVVEQIERAAEAYDPDGGAPWVSVALDELGYGCWTATVCNARGEVLGSASRRTEIEACRALLREIDLARAGRGGRRPSHEGMVRRPTREVPGAGGRALKAG